MWRGEYGWPAKTLSMMLYSPCRLQLTVAHQMEGTLSQNSTRPCPTLTSPGVQVSGYLHHYFLVNRHLRISYVSPDCVEYAVTRWEAGYGCLLLMLFLVIAGSVLGAGLVANMPPLAVWRQIKLVALKLGTPKYSAQPQLSSILHSYTLITR